MILAKGSLVISRRDVFLASLLLSVHEVSFTTLNLTCQKVVTCF